MTLDSTLFFDTTPAQETTPCDKKQIYNMFSRVPRFMLVFSKNNTLSDGKQNNNKRASLSPGYLKYHPPAATRLPSNIQLSPRDRGAPH